MFNINTMSFKESFTYWFKRIGISDSWTVTMISDNSKVGTIVPDDQHEPHFIPADETFSADDIPQVMENFTRFTMFRPEVHIGGRVSRELVAKGDPNQEQIELIKEELENYIIACCYATHGNDDTAKKYVTRAIQWLESTDFFIAPASTVYHDCCPGGLAKHTLKVVDKIIELSTIDTYAEVDLAQAILAAICHDWCKIDFYQPYKRNVKNEETGVWEQQLAYKYKGSSLPFGHGVTSMFIAMKIFKLTTEQALAIRWHMNEYDVSDAQKHDLMDANEKYPMVTMLQTADRLSIL